MSEEDGNLDEPYNASDPVQVNTARKKARRKSDERLDVMKALLQNKQTRAWLHDLIEGADPHGNAIIQGDTHATYFLLGQQNVGKRLLADAVQFPDLYLLMMQEARMRK